MATFRILGVTILKGCDTKISKILQEEKFYPFCAEDISDVKKHLYDLQTPEGDTICVNMTSIVGKNGDGKSTIIEVIIRILNNFSCATGFKIDHDSLTPVQGLRAELEYEIGKRRYKIRIADKSEGIDGVQWTQGNCDLLSGITSGTTLADRKQWIKEHCEKHIFYTMVNNYSLYAYNSKVFKAESEGAVAWIDAVFHKNDAYQTPIVISPMRTDGNMNVNKEHYLSRQRLLSLYTASGDDKKIRKVGEDADMYAYGFELEKESKFEKVTLFGYLEANNNKYLEWDDLVYKVNPNKKRPKRKQIVELSDEAIDNITKHTANFFVDLRKLLAKNHVFCDRLDIDSHSRMPYHAQGNGSDVYKYFKWLIERAKTRPKLKMTYDDMFSSPKSGRVINVLRHLNYTQLCRIVLILQVWEYLCQKYGWSSKEERNQSLLHLHENPMYAARWYMVYKVISVLETYLPYRNRVYMTDSTYEMIGNTMDVFFKTLHLDIKQILEDRHDYVNLKLQQTLNYLNYISKHADSSFYPDDESYVVHTFEEMKAYVSACQPNCPLSEVKYYLPPPIFVGDIKIKRKGETFGLMGLSSGEQQLLNTTGSIVYHLRNISDRVDRGISYDYVNLILEEVELYYHPEYQRQFVNYLLEQIRRGGIRNIKGINICMVTHSPFVLSDILPENVLRLEKGEMKNNSIQTFGANIHDLLRHPFFMHGHNIGDFAQSVVDKILLIMSLQRHIDVHNDFDKTLYLEENPTMKETLKEVCEGENLSPELFQKYDKNVIHELIELIDEPLVRNTLLNTYREIYGGDTESTKERLLRQLKELTGKNYVVSE